jgi:putative hydroxymethylpyrimidine transporter CytX
MEISAGAATALAPVAVSERQFDWPAHAALWFSMGVGLLVMQMGAYLVPSLGNRDAALAIGIGSVLGAGLLAWTAKLGCDSGLGSAGLMHITFGSNFARLPVILNIAQLIGWTTFELVVMRDASVAATSESIKLAISPTGAMVATTLFWGVVLTALLTGSMIKLVRTTISRYALPLVIASLAWLSWQFGQQLQTTGFAAFWARPGNGSMGLAAALDLVIAMPVSWLPLVADYARHGRSGQAALGGTWFGYACANIWCYALGVLVAGFAADDQDLIATLLLAQGGLLAMGIILVDEIDNAYGDVYSGAVSAHSIRPKWSVRRWGVALALMCTVLALVLPMHGLEPFLILLSSVFVPLYGVILGRLSPDQDRFTPAQKQIEWLPALIWFAGIAFYQGLSQWAPQWGATLPTLALTYFLSWALRVRGLQARGA